MLTLTQPTLIAVAAAAALAVLLFFAFKANKTLGIVVAVTVAAIGSSTFWAPLGLKKGLLQDTDKGLPGLWRWWLARNGLEQYELAVAVFFLALLSLGFIAIVWKTNFGKSLAALAAILGGLCFIIPDLKVWLMAHWPPIGIGIGIAAASIAASKVPMIGKQLAYVGIILGIGIALWPALQATAPTAWANFIEWTSDVRKSREAEKRQAARVHAVAARAERPTTNATCTGIVGHRTVLGWEEIRNDGCQLYFEVAPLPEFPRPCITVNDGSNHTFCRGDEISLAKGTGFMAHSQMGAGYSRLPARVCIVKFVAGTPIPYKGWLTERCY